MNPSEMETYIQKAAQIFNQEIQQKRRRPPFIPHGEYDTLLCDERFGKDEVVRITFHGFSFKYLTKKSQDILQFEKEKNRRAKLHNHEFFEFIHVYRGTVTQHTPGEQFQIKGPHLLMMNSYVIHSPVPDDEDTIMFNFIIQKKVIESMFASLSPFDRTFSHFFLESLYGPRRDKNYLSFPLNPETEETVQMIIKEYYDGDSCYQQVIYALLIYLFAQISELQKELHANYDLSPDTCQSEEAFTTNLLHYLQENYLQATLDQLSETLGYSKYHLSRLIRQKTGMSFKELITNYKMIHASNYLEYSDFSLSKICELIGYYDKSHFSKTFKSIFQMSPQEYRMQRKSHT